MTNEEAIQDLKDILEEATSDKDAVCYVTSEDAEALDMAIETLQTEPTKAVPPSLADVYKWERDIALSQLEEYGIGFAEKKRDDLVEVVRCKDCRFWKNEHLCLVMSRYGSIDTKAEHYCSWGERKEE